MSEPMKSRVEKGRLAKAYKLGKKEQREKILARSDENFRQTIVWLQDSAVAGDSRIIIGMAASWAQCLDEEQRLFLLSEISNACDRIRTSKGQDPLSDPLPPDESVFTTCRELLR